MNEDGWWTMTTTQRLSKRMKSLLFIKELGSTGAICHGHGSYVPERDGGISNY